MLDMVSIFKFSDYLKDNNWRAITQIIRSVKNFEPLEPYQQNLEARLLQKGDYGLVNVLISLGSAPAIALRCVFATAPIVERTTALMVRSRCDQDWLSLSPASKGSALKPVCESASDPVLRIRISTFCSA